ncbi:uncharacterized protein N7498_007878 [Penicillium cinerascens]|uniref:Uncharacterized protein n=1 Tax=Penicillium cinerascens TaxID=70096 RepID=A0A9W9MD58_9EURO|nr:uncharacterized protein N7498_007878 [Penicillium cinerascens]KAJ5198761.1 hypothetical protein N7498_007878 [Penicillium cinerascens]
MAMSVLVILWYPLFMTKKHFQVLNISIHVEEGIDASMVPFGKNGRAILNRGAPDYQSVIEAEVLKGDIETSAGKGAGNGRMLLIGETT